MTVATWPEADVPVVSPPACAVHAIVGTLTSAASKLPRRPEPARTQMAGGDEPIHDSHVSTVTGTNISNRPGAPLLAIRDLATGYGAGAVLQNIDLDVFPDEVVALLGANGAGKSTLLRAASGMLPGISGEILWQGERLPSHAQPHKIVMMGLSHLPEGRGSFPDLTVMENLTMGTFAAGDRREGKLDAQQDLEVVFGHFPKLSDRLAQLAGSLSRGEQQMLAIGRALLSRPRLLMMDEQWLGLAPVISQQVFEIVRDIASAGVPILLVECLPRHSLWKVLKSMAWLPASATRSTQSSRG